MFVGQINTKILNARMICCVTTVLSFSQFEVNIRLFSDCFVVLVAGLSYCLTLGILDASYIL